MIWNTVEIQLLLEENVFVISKKTVSNKTMFDPAKGHTEFRSGAKRCISHKASLVIVTSSLHYCSVIYIFSLQCPRWLVVEPSVLSRITAASGVAAGRLSLIIACVTRRRVASCRVRDAGGPLGLVNIVQENGMPLFSDNQWEVKPRTM